MEELLNSFPEELKACDIIYRPISNENLDKNLEMYLGVSQNEFGELVYILYIRDQVMLYLDSKNLFALFELFGLFIEKSQKDFFNLNTEAIEKKHAKIIKDEFSSLRVGKVLKELPSLNLEYAEELKSLLNSGNDEAIPENFPQDIATIMGEMSEEEKENFVKEQILLKKEQDEKFLDEFEKSLLGDVKIAEIPKIVLDIDHFVNVFNTFGLNAFREELFKLPEEDRAIMLEQVDERLKTLKIKESNGENSSTS